MNRSFIHFSLALLLGLAAFPQAHNAAQQLEERKAKAERMDEKDRARIYSEIVRDLVELAAEQYSGGEVEKAEASIQDAVQYAEKSVVSAEDKQKKIKDAEINLRKAERRLDEIRHTIPLDDQPPVKSALDKISKLRSDLLNAMFARKKK